MNSQFKEWNEILGIKDSSKEEIYDLSENGKWYSGKGSPEERAQEPLRAWNNRVWVVADV